MERGRLQAPLSHSASVAAGMHLQNRAGQTEHAPSTHGRHQALHKGVSVVHFETAQDAIKAVRTMVKYAPSAVEILSRLLIGYSRKNIETAAMCGFLKGEPDSIQIIELYGNDPEEIRLRAHAMHEELHQSGFGYCHDYYPEGKEYHDVWGIRERGLGLLLGEPADKKGVPVIEDAVGDVAKHPHLVLQGRAGDGEILLEQYNVVLSHGDDGARGWCDGVKPARRMNSNSS